MRSLKALFDSAQHKDPEATTFMQFCTSILGKKFNRETLAINYKALIHPSEYEQKDKIQLLDHFYKLSNSPVDTEKEMNFVSDCI